MYKFFIKPLLFRLDPEEAHSFTFKWIAILFKIPFIESIFRLLYVVKSPSLKRTVFGLSFENPVGLGAGFDKDAKLIDEFSNLGFGFIEIGTVTPKPQAGNDKPRLFRLVEDNAVINRMGFNNGGAIEIVKRLKARKSKIIIGGNIGKNKLTPNENAVDDYVICFNELYDYVDYFVVNVSSPNTPNLRALQEKEPLTNLLNDLMKVNLSKPKPKPILLKIAPDLTDTQLDDIIDIVKSTKIDGLVATNTTISRENLKTDSAKIEKIGMGGLSGKPVKDRSTEVIRYIAKKSNHSIPIIGIGGIFSAKDAQEKLDAGASLVQLYTGFIYEGPQLVADINKSLVKTNQ